MNSTQFLHTLVNAGTALTIQPERPYTKYRVAPAAGVTLVGSFVASINNGTFAAVAGDKYELKYDSNGFTVNLNGNTFTVFGNDVSEEIINTGFTAITTYDATSASYNTVISPDFDGTNDVVDTADVVDNAITLAKMAGIARGNIIIGDASGNPAVLDASTSGQILVGDGSDIASVAVSGDITLSSAGVATLGANVVGLDHFLRPAEGSIIIGDAGGSDAVQLDISVSGQILVGDGTSSKSVAVSGDATLSSAGVLTLGPGVVDTAELIADAVDGTRIADAAIEKEHFNTGAIVVDTTLSTQATGADTNETTFATYSQAANTFFTDGNYIKIIAWATTAINANTKTIQIDIDDGGGATTVAQSATTTTPNALKWRYECEILRAGATTALCNTKISFDGVAGEIVNTTVTPFTWANVCTFRVTGTNGIAAANDIEMFGSLMTELK